MLCRGCEVRPLADRGARNAVALVINSLPLIYRGRPPVIGSGKYDDLCTHVRKAAHASAAIVIIFDGDKGSGFSLQADAMTNAQLILRLPELLRDVANQIEADTSKA